MTVSQVARFLRGQNLVAMTALRPSTVFGTRLATSVCRQTSELRGWSVWFLLLLRPLFS